MNPTARSPRCVRFGLFEIDLYTHELRKQGRKIKLPEQQARILALLLERAGEVVSREDLRKKLWADDTFVDFDHSLNTGIMRLREALGESSGNPIYIETLPRIGYRFIAPVEELQESESRTKNAVADAVPSPVSPSATVSEPTTEAIASSARDAARPKFQRIAITGLVVLAAAITIFAVVRFRASQEPGQPQKSLVVLPLENLSQDVEQEYFADGMTDELTARLAQIRSLRVISRTSAMEYKRTHKPLSEIARELNVDAIVEGTVLRSGNRVRITAELIQASSDRHLWAQTYESELGDILGLQSQVASAIASEIRIKLTPEEQKLFASNKTVSTQSYENYLKGKYYWNKRSEEALKKAIDYFKLATEQDDHSALAFAGLADCYSIIGSAIVGTVPSRDVAANAKAAALKALELDPSLAEAHTSLATVSFNYDWDWNAAENGFERSMQLNPNYATNYQRYSLYLMAMGRAQESIAQMDHARSLDPLSISVNFSYGWRLYMARQYQQAIEQLKTTLEMDPNFVLPHIVLGQAYEQAGRYDDAIAELKKAVSISQQSPPTLSALAHAYAVAGKKSEAEAVLQSLLAASKNQYVSPFYISVVYAGLGQQQQAMDWLEKAYEDRSNSVIFMKVDPELDAMRSNPRFQTLLKRLAFPH